MGSIFNEELKVLTTWNIRMLLAIRSENNHFNFYQKNCLKKKDKDVCPHCKQADLFKHYYSDCTNYEVKIEVDRFKKIQSIYN